MVAGSNTFINTMLEKIGFTNAFAHKTRYPEISLDELTQLKVDYIFLSSEPFPFKEKHYDEFRPFCKPLGIRLIDGEAFSWYGSRLLKSANYLFNLANELGIYSK